LDILVLHTVQGAPLHGYAIGKALRDRTDGVLSVEEGALYPALHRLERRGLLESAWGRTETGRRAKFYRASQAGLAHLGEESVRWQAFSNAVDTVLGRSGEA
jgi:transcriptional regulator